MPPTKNNPIDKFLNFDKRKNIKNNFIYTNFNFTNINRLKKIKYHHILFLTTVDFLDYHILNFSIFSYKSS
jgi:hypothetical protein